MNFREALQSRILVLDGAMGTMLQKLGLSGGDNELLNLTSAEAIIEIHRKYIDAGADIIETNSFGANRISQAEYGHAADSAKLSFEAARLARTAADEAASGSATGRKIWVAGSVGPTGKSLSLSSDADRPAYREVDFETMVSVFREQMTALKEGGSDLIIVETCFDALNTKAAIKAMESVGLPLIISATVSDRSGRTLTGQTLESFFHSIEHAPTLTAFGINCALGSAEMAPLVREVCTFCHFPTVFYPNAGVPNELGRYEDTPEDMAAVIGRLAREGMLNIAGGCCGTTPEHIRAIAASVKGIRPRVPRPKDDRLSVCGLETVTIDKRLNFTNIGERTNVAGSRKFARLISEGNYDAALETAVCQVAGGASIIDINMDDPMLDRAACMRDFIRSTGTAPEVAKAAIMIDSSDWGTVLEGLRNAQGKCIVNSISLKDGEETFLQKAGQIRSYGAAMVVMAFDESGQAETLERKIEICSRSYSLLTSVAGIAPQDIIFDCNILTIGTGIPEHAMFGIDFIKAVRWIKSNLPGALTSGGVSNLSFAFRGNNPVREAMHSVFLYHAVREGLDMAIVNPQALQIYDNIEPELRDCIEDVLFNRDPEATSRLVAKASSMAADAPARGSSPLGPITSTNPEERLRDAVIKGDASRIDKDALECLSQLGDPVNVIEGPLMKGMEKVGELFATGRMFLPQVVRSAKMMREAISVLTPYMKESRRSGRAKVFVIATVRGDVHDIGKNITSSILMCSGFEVHDLGVMVPCETILREADEVHADIIGVSGLITPSLSRMEELCREMKSRGMSTPLFVGGAAASAVYTAEKLHPLYDYVYYGADASATAVMAKKYVQNPGQFILEERQKMERLISLRSAGPGSVCPCCFPAPKPLPLQTFKDIPLTTLSSSEVMEYFDWRMFSTVCGVREVASIKNEVLTILKRMDVTLCARFFECRRKEDSLICRKGSGGGSPLEFKTGKNLAGHFPENRCASVGVFGVRADSHGCESDDLLVHAACVTLAEAGSGYLESLLSKSLPEGLKAFLPAIGYPICPDHSLKADVLPLLPDSLGITLTESYSMIPEASICGFVVGIDK